MAEWKWIFRCPVEGCGFVSRSYPGLKKHYRCNHAGDVCPVCGHRMRNIGTLAGDVAAIDALRVIEEHHLQYPLHVVSHKIVRRKSG